MEPRMFECSYLRICQMCHSDSPSAAEPAGPRVYCHNFLHMLTAKDRALQRPQSHRYSARSGPGIGDRLCRAQVNFELGKIVS